MGMRCKEHNSLVRNAGHLGCRRLYSLRKLLSKADHITLKSCNCECRTYFDAEAAPQQYQLSDFVLENLAIRAENTAFDETVIDRLTLRNVSVVEL